MNGLWLELDHYQDIKMKCSGDTRTLLNILERDRVFEFLAGLNVEFDQVRIQIFGKEKLPLLSEVFSIERGEESRRIVMLESQQSEGSTMVSKKIVDRGNNFNSLGQGLGDRSDQKQGKQSALDDLWCTYYKKPSHPKENSFELHGKAQVLNRNGGFKRNQQGSSVNFTNQEGPTQNLNRQSFGEDDWIC
ncbi:hypothetical protein P3X46_010346 [Hevea brasiliensis]|uniref:Uncharacterized protein n=1 Tax=Hevea brasiliensis TaxID=3981 RepID=A0ABQ9MG45_HEVBR|nr:hypothetical protein P3X46_010346 [Hevea brasiliensis]